MSDFKEVVDQLRRKDKNSLTADELAFLAARRSYLSVDERICFGLDEETPKVQAPTKAQLKAQLKELGVEFDPKATAEELQALLDSSAEAPAVEATKAPKA